MPEYGDTRTCNICGETKPIDQFALKGKGYREAKCEPCRYKKRMSDPERKTAARAAVHRRMIARRNAEAEITEEEYQQRLQEQNGLCALCSGPQTHGGGRLCIDHDHATGAVRGLLCHHCNKALGYFRDDIQALQRAIMYLTRAPH